MKDSLHIDDEHEEAGQESTLQYAVLIAEALRGDVPPAENLWEQQEGTRALGVAEKNSSGT